MREEKREVELEYVCFVVANKPYCLWGWDLREDNLRFLEGIRTDYYSFVIDAFGKSESEENEQLTALALRMAYFQGLETLFAFIGAALQAPHCVQGWLHRYRDPHVKKVARAIHERKPIRTRLKLESFSWRELTEALFVYIGDDALRKEYIDVYSSLWSGFASDFLKDKYRDEYNSIKHGLRVVPGGFSLAIGMEQSPGVPAEHMRAIGSSNFGTQHMVTTRLSDEHRHHLVVKKRSLNWSPFDMGYALHLISYSLTNIVAFLKAFNGVDPKKVSFVRPTSAEAAKEPWQRLKTLGATALETGPRLDPDDLDLDATSPEVIRAMYEQTKDADE